MNLAELSESAVRKRLCNDGLILKIGPFSFRLISPIRSVHEGIRTLYGDYPLASEGSFVDFTVTIAAGSGLRRWISPQAIFRFDGMEPFAPLPGDHAFPLLEWAMNWCISSNAHHYLLLHSAVIERGGSAVILPAPPGSGKSTLCAGLVNRGWRLLSDELALISLTDGMITPLVRPISLKNQSIELIGNYVPEAVFTNITHDTSKGSVTHMRVSIDHLHRIKERANPRWVIFPKYRAGSPAQLTKRSKANSMLELGRNSFNYMILGVQGFEVLSRVVDASDCYDFQYSQLDEAVAIFEQLVAEKH